MHVLRRDWFFFSSAIYINVILHCIVQNCRLIMLKYDQHLNPYLVILKLLKDRPTKNPYLNFKRNIFFSIAENKLKIAILARGYFDIQLVFLLFLNVKKSNWRKEFVLQLAAVHCIYPLIARLGLVQLLINN